MKARNVQRFVILDARPQEDYQQQRIPTARRVDASTWAKDFTDGKEAEAWGRRIGELDIRAESQVVVYDDASDKDAARIWWILRYWGVKDVRLLNGGWKGWKSANLPLATDEPRPPAPAQFTASAKSKRLVTKQQVIQSLSQRRLQMVDARSEQEYCGLDPLKNKQAGAVPGAKHVGNYYPGWSEWGNANDTPILPGKPREKPE